MSRQPTTTLGQEDLLCTNLLAVVSVYLHQLREIKLGSLQNLNLAHDGVLERVDTSSSLLYFLSNNLGNELRHKFL
jgi:hypothetical protein